MSQKTPDYSDDLSDEKVIQALNLLYTMQVDICIDILKELRSVDLSDKNIIIRALMRESPAYDIGCTTAAEDCAVDMWVDRAEYVDAKSFNLYVTQAEDNVLWNIEKKGRKPRRLEVPQQRITVRGDAMNVPPFIPLAYLTILGSKLLAIADPDKQTSAELSNYDDETVMMGLADHFQSILEIMTDETPDGDNDARYPVN